MCPRTPFRAIWFLILPGVGSQAGCSITAQVIPFTDGSRINKNLCLLCPRTSVFRILEQLPAFQAALVRCQDCVELFCYDCFKMTHAAGTAMRSQPLEELACYLHESNNPRLANLAL